MAKPIFTSRYIRDALPEHLQNYVRYISTREGVEKADENKKNIPITAAQKDLIRHFHFMPYCRKAFYFGRNSEYCHHYPFTL